MTLPWLRPVPAGVELRILVQPRASRDEVAGVMLIVGDARDPFTALDIPFLRALGQQVGAALENADLNQLFRQYSQESE